MKLLPPGKGTDLIALGKKWLAKTGQKAGQAADDVIEAEYKVLNPGTATPSAPLLLGPGSPATPQLSTLQKGVLGTGGALAATGTLLPGVDQETQSTPTQGEIPPTDEPTPSFLERFTAPGRQIVPGELPKQEAPKPVPAPQPAKVPNRQPQIAEQTPPMSDIDFGTGSINTVDNLANAQSAQQDAIFANQMGRAGELVGSSIAHAKPIAQEFFKDNIDQAGNITKNFLQRAEQEKNDPNSPVSKGFKEYLKRFGINVKGDFNAASGEKLLPMAWNEYKNKQDNETRKEVARENRELQRDMFKDRQKERDFQREMRRDEKTEREDTRKKEKQDQFIQSFRKETSTGPLAKLRQNYLNSERISKSLEQYMKNPSGYTDYATLMGGLKALQGDDSVVREAEMRLGTNATSLFNKAANAVQQAATGKSLQGSQREDILKAVKILEQVTEQQYVDQVSPIVQHAVENKYNLNQILPERLANKLQPGQASEAPTSEVTPGWTKKGYNPKTNQTQFIYPDGSKKTVAGKQ